MQPHRRQPTRLPHPWDSPGKNTGVGCHFLLQCMKVKIESEVAQSCPTLSDPINCSLPGSSVHGIFQARVLEWGAITFSLYRATPLETPSSTSQEGGKFWTLLIHDHLPTLPCVRKQLVRKYPICGQWTHEEGIEWVGNVHILITVIDGTRTEAFSKPEPIHATLTTTQPQA